MSKDYIEFFFLIIHDDTAWRDVRGESGKYRESQKHKQERTNAIIAKKVTMKAKVNPEIQQQT